MQFDLSRWSLKALFQFRSRVQGEPVREHRVTNPFHAVSIQYGSQACPAVRQFGETRFLSREAPRLPIAACSARYCECRYRHHDDRRRGLRRASDESGVSPPWHRAERRTNRGRRATDA